MSDTTITPEEKASWRERLESPFSCHYSKHGAFPLRLLTALEAAEAESARLRAECDWLAGSIAEDGCPYLAFWSDFEGDMRPDWCICTDTEDDGFECTGDPKECWKKEAARRAVGEG